MYTFEINSARKDTDYVSGNIKRTSPVVEIFSAMARGESLEKFGTKGNTAVTYIKELGSRAQNGDTTAISEINVIRTFIMEPLLLKEIQILSFFGGSHPIGFDESAEVETYSHEGEKSRFQAANGDVPFPAIVRKKHPVAMQTVSGGIVADYRRIQLGDMSKENEGMEQVRIDIRNKAVKYVIDAIYTAIKTATGVKYFSEDAGILKTHLDSVLTNVRRWGRPNIFGDYAVVSQINQFAGWSDGSSSSPFQGVSDAAMEEIRKTGLLAYYNGSAIVEIPNQYDVTTLNAARDNYNTMLPQNLLFVIPSGAKSPVQTLMRPLTSMNGDDVTTGHRMARFDMEIGIFVDPNSASKIGLIADTNLQ
jgi:hypothetical protein